MTDRGHMQSIATALWRDNPGLVQLLGLCPLLAVTGSFVNGLGLGIATLAVLTVSNGLVSATRRLLQKEIRIPIYVLIIASLVTCVELLFKAYFPALDRALGIFIPLIVTNCAIVARAEVFASRNPVFSSIVDGFGMGLGYLLILVKVGLMREMVGQGTLFADMHLLLGGDPIDGLVLADTGWLIAILPPGAFFALAIAIASKNAIDRRRNVRLRERAGLR